MPEWLTPHVAVILLTAIVVPAVTWAVRIALVSRKDLAAESEARAAAIAGVHGRMSEIDRRLDRGEDRFGRLEIQLQQMPTKDDLHAVSLALQAVSGQIAKVDTEVKALGRQIEKTDERLAVIDDYLRQDSLIEKQRST